MNASRTFYGNISADASHPSRGAVLTIDSAPRHGGENIPLAARGDVEATIASRGIGKVAIASSEFARFPYHVHYEGMPSPTPRAPHLTGKILDKLFRPAPAPGTTVIRAAVRGKMITVAIV